MRKFFQGLRAGRWRRKVDSISDVFEQEVVVRMIVDGVEKRASLFMILDTGSSHNFIATESLEKYFGNVLIESDYATVQNALRTDVKHTSIGVIQLEWFATGRRNKRFQFKPRFEQVDCHVFESNSSEFILGGPDIERLDLLRSSNIERPFLNANMEQKEPNTTKEDDLETAIGPHREEWVTDQGGRVEQISTGGREEGGGNDKNQIGMEGKIETRNIETETGDTVDCGNLSEHGSGYASMSRPTISADVYQPLSRDHPDHHITSKPILTEEHHEHQHATSGDDGHVLDASSDDGDVWLTENHPIVDFLAEDTKFRALCEHGLVNVEKPRFAKNIQELLKFFHENLSTEARSEEEKILARSLGQTQTRYHITQQLIQSIEDQDIRHERAAQSLRDYLADRYTGPIDLPEGEVQSIYTIDDAPEVEQDTWFRFSSELEKFLQDSQSFQTLIRDYILWLLPIEVREVLLSIPRSNIYLSQAQDLSLMNCIKSWAEDQTNVDWDWWPLVPRKRYLSADETRLYWTCTCGKLLWIEILSKYNKLVEGMLEMGHEAPLAPYQCSPVRMRVPLIDYLKAIFRTAPATSQATATSATALRYMPSAPAPSSAGQRSAFSASSPRLPTPTNTIPQNQAVNQGFSGQIASHILFGVPRGSPIIAAAQLSVSDQSTDAVLFSDIKQCYRSHRGLLRLWFSPWRLKYCTVVKFNRWDSKQMVREYPDLPEQQDYKYNPRAGDPLAKNPPIPHHTFQALYDSCSMPCSNWFPHSCKSPQMNAAMVTRFPKRDKCFLQDQTSPIWGLEATFHLSARSVIIYHIIVLAGPFILFGLWIKANPTDLQNASIPITIAFGALSLMWMVPGLLTDEKD